MTILRQAEGGVPVAELCREHDISCLIPLLNGAILSQEWKEALWARFVTEAPRPRTPSELR